MRNTWLVCLITKTQSKWLRIFAWKYKRFNKCDKNNDNFTMSIFPFLSDSILKRKKKKKHMTFVDRKLGLSSNYSWLIVYPGRYTHRGRRLGSVVLDSDRKNKDPRAHRDRAVQFSAHECLIFNRIAAMPRLGRGNVLRGKLNSIASCWLTKHEARVRMPSTEIDHH